MIRIIDIFYDDGYDCKLPKNELFKELLNKYAEPINSISAIYSILKDIHTIQVDVWNKNIIIETNDNSYMFEDTDSPNSIYKILSEYFSRRI